MSYSIMKLGGRARVCVGGGFERGGGQPRSLRASTWTAGRGAAWRRAVPLRLALGGAQARASPAEQADHQEGESQDLGLQRQACGAEGWRGQGHDRRWGVLATCNAAPVAGGTAGSPVRPATGFRRCRRGPRHGGAVAAAAAGRDSQQTARTQAARCCAAPRCRAALRPRRRTRHRLLAVNLPPQQPYAHKVGRLSQHEQRVVIFHGAPQDEEQLGGGAGPGGCTGSECVPWRWRSRAPAPTGAGCWAQTLSRGGWPVPAACPRTSTPAAQPRTVFSFELRVCSHLTACSSGSFTFPSLSSSARPARGPGPAPYGPPLL